MKRFFQRVLSQQKTSCSISTSSASVDKSHFLPSFISQLSDPKIRTVLLSGCGGGFDFVHSLVLYPELIRMGKKIVIGSYSFGNPTKITGATPFFAEGEAIAVRVSASSVADSHYGPEVHLCSYLDQAIPSYAPHSIYAYYARSFSVPLLTRLYEKIIAIHAVDAVIVVDGGSDALMVGDEQGLGDPIEDAVSIAAVSALTSLRAKILAVIGLGTDRYNHVSDAASLRAIAELTRQGGFLGAVSLEPESVGSRFYRDCLDHIYQRQQFRSVVAGTIDAAIQGWYGSGAVPPNLEQRVATDQLFFWPIMAIVWGFDIDAVAQRSLIASWIRDCETVKDCIERFRFERRLLANSLRPVENLPRHEDMRR